MFLFDQTFETLFTTLKQRCFNVAKFNVNKQLKYDVVSTLPSSTLINSWNMTLFQRWRIVVYSTKFLKHYSPQCSLVATELIQNSIFTVSVCTQRGQDSERLNANARALPGKHVFVRLSSLIAWHDGVIGRANRTGNFSHVVCDQ